MDIVLIGPFMLPQAPGLLARFQQRPATPHEGLVFDRHASSMFALSQHEAVLRRATAWGELVLRDGVTKFGSVMMRVTVEDREHLHGLEPLIAESVNQILAERYGPAGDEAALGYPAGKVLWWHRLLLDPRSDEPRAIRLFGERFLASEVVNGRVADGFTSIDATHGVLVDEVIAGLTAATEDWLLIDDLTRRVRMTLVRSKGDDEVLGQALAQAELLTEEMALAVLLIDERRRHLANATKRVHEAASTVWGVSEDRASLIHHAESVQGLIRTENGRRSARVDAQRNSILFGFAVVTVLQSVLMVVEFAVGDPLGFVSTARVVAAGVVLIGTVGILVRYMLDPRSSDAASTTHPDPPLAPPRSPAATDALAGEPT